MRKILNGVVVSVKMQKTAVVEVSRKKQHPLYKKLLTKSKRYKADMGKFSVSLGDLVKIGETKPISKGKNFEIISVSNKKDAKLNILKIDDQKIIEEVFSKNNHQNSKGKKIEEDKK